ncbi:lactosylceramide 4-alpha-galactosyltransferase-like [Phyllobates terribilis]|uniref:lactosylceramide 4-alpha-galactosyltransferase-like n=1 Tax=Phyllobates terribilis TaxID=111132 RepID=UPI003CCB6C7F
MIEKVSNSIKRFTIFSSVTLALTLLIFLSLSCNNHFSTIPTIQQPQTANSSSPPLFEHRIAEFLHQSGRACDPQFFMTWINSSAEQFSTRQILALETLFSSHPNACLTILSDTLDSAIGRLILNPLTDLGYRILLISPDIQWLLSGTSAIEWLDGIHRGEINIGEIPFPQNLSNLLRLAILYKYGGVYLDTDFIVLRKFTGLRNSIGAQRIHGHTGKWTRLNNAVLIFDRNHPILLAFIEEFVAGFDGSKWGHNGPLLVSRVVENGGLLGNFTVLPPAAFYPVNWIKIVGLFKRPTTQAQRSWAQRKVEELKNGAYVVHLWNKQSAGLMIEEESVIGRLISDHCIICHNIFNTS